ncbi:MAG: DNA double-strand break repair nuclease NurA [Candidatus Sigynarchaeota archaeon]
MISQPSLPFEELPEALVERMLGKTAELGRDLSQSFGNILGIKDDVRAEIEAKGLLQKDTDMILDPTNPTTLGVDGSYAIEKLLSIDMVATAAVAVEGLRPPTNTVHWPRPHHLADVFTVPHNESTMLAVRGIMTCMEMNLAANAPHDVIFLDYSLFTPAIYINQALGKISEVSERLRRRFNTYLLSGLNFFNKVVNPGNANKIFAGVPKYTTMTELSKQLSIPAECDDRALLTFILSPGELVGPFQVSRAPFGWKLEGSYRKFQPTIDAIYQTLKALDIIYYRPSSLYPALRIEVTRDVAGDKNKLARVLEAVRLQCVPAGMMEPYPLYMADRMVKHLHTALPAIRQTTTKEMALKWEQSLGNMYMAMHGYRTEFGH